MTMMMMLESTCKSDSPAATRCPLKWLVCCSPDDSGSGGICCRTRDPWFAPRRSDQQEICACTRPCSGPTAHIAGSLYLSRAPNSRHRVTASSRHFLSLADRETTAFVPASRPLCCRSMASPDDCFRDACWCDAERAASRDGCRHGGDCCCGGGDGRPNAHLDWISLTVCPCLIAAADVGDACWPS